MSSVTAGTSGMPMYTMRLWSRSEGRSGGADSAPVIALRRRAAHAAGHSEPLLLTKGGPGGRGGQDGARPPARQATKAVPSSKRVSARPAEESETTHVRRLLPHSLSRAPL